MKKKYNKIKIIIIIMLLLLTTGCSTVLKDSNNKAVKNENTGQTLMSNILCKVNMKVYGIHFLLNH